MLNHLALKTSMVALLGTIAPAQAGDGGALPVVRLVLGERSGPDAYDAAGLGWRRRAPQLSPPSAKEDSKDLRDVVGSLPPEGKSDEILAVVGDIGGFSFCDCAGEGAAQPSRPAEGLGGEARLTQLWTARLTSFRYDLGRPAFMVPPAVLGDLPTQSDSGGEIESPTEN